MADLLPDPTARKNSPAQEGGDLALRKTRRRTVGPIEFRVRGDVEALLTAHPMAEAIAEMSYALARALDDGAGLATAAINRELRANLAELSRLGVPDDDDFDAAVSTPVRHPQEP